MIKTMVIEPVRAFNGMDVLVARAEGLFAAEGLDVHVLQEPWITVAEKAGCRFVSTTFFYGTWVANDSVDSDTYAAFVRATTEAARRINADKRNYVHYYTREYADSPEVNALTPDDFNLGRIQVKAPEPIQEAEARLEWEWMASWGLLHGEFNADTQINAAVQQVAHAGR